MSQSWAKTLTKIIDCEMKENVNDPSEKKGKGKLKGWKMFFVAYRGLLNGSSNLLRKLDACVKSFLL